ncbi:hypothetical protein [Photobacterium kasasachensis]|uniref:hypothetical protein n=1 Tax=Photobacterium kasasachensis TaxID=2910240 RepID=UPI003D0F2004
MGKVKTHRLNKKIDKPKMFSVPLKKAKFVILFISSLLVVQGGYLYYSAEQYKSQLEANQLEIKEQEHVINELVEQLGVVEKSFSDLKKEVSVSSITVVDQNRVINDLEQELRKTKNAFNNKSKQYVQLKRSYKKQLDHELDLERKQLAETQRLLETELVTVRKKEESISSKISDVGEWERKKAEFDRLYANSALEAENEKRVSDLMSQFNDLRVDLDVVNECDKDYLYRYNEAKSLLSHIRTFIQKYEMKQDFYYFVISNDSLISAQNRKLCLTN